jgi:hypothetical protein
MERLVSETYTFTNKGITLRVEPLGNVSKRDCDLVTCARLFRMGKQLPGIYMMRQFLPHIIEQAPETAIKLMQEKYDTLDRLGCPVVPMAFDIAQGIHFIQIPRYYNRNMLLNCSNAESFQNICREEIFSLYNSMLGIAKRAYATGNGVSLDARVYAVVTPELPRRFNVVLFDIGIGSTLLQEQRGILKPKLNHALYQAELAFRTRFPSIEIPPMVESGIIH